MTAEVIIASAPVRRRVKGPKGPRGYTRERRRGQRKGKSRGRQPRLRNPVPPPPSEERLGRTMVRRLRLIDHWYDRQEQLCTLFKSSSWYRSSGGGFTVAVAVEMGDEVFFAWRARWCTLHGAISPFGEEVLFCSRIGPSFLYWLEQRFRIVVDNPPRGRKRTGLEDLRSWRESVRARTDRSTTMFRSWAVNKGPQPQNYRMDCVWCKKTFSS